MNKALLSLCVVTMLLTGCSAFGPGGGSDYACPGMPKGVVCKTPREVYNKTDSETGKKSGKGNLAPTYLFATEPRGKENLNPIPVLEQAKVMRIWISPWVDSNKDLHWPGVVFTQIQPRQWSFGSEDFNGVEPPVPHRSFMQGQAPKPAPGKGGAAANQNAQPNDDEILN